MDSTKQLNNKSIKKRVVFQFSTLIALSIFLMISFVAYFVTDNMSKQAELLVKNRADFIQNKIENRLDYLIESTKLLARNELMINALIDEDGRKEYLTLLVKNFMEGKNVLTLSVVDFDGKAIFKTMNNVPQYKDSLHLRRALAMGETTYYLNQDTNQMIVISPMKYYNTTQGSLIAEFNFDKVVDKYKTEYEYEYIRLIKNENTVYEYNFKKNETYYSYKSPLNLTHIFNKLEVALEMGVSESYYLAPIRDAIVKLSFLGLLLLLVGVFISYILSISITNPILKLYKRVKQKHNIDNYEPLGTNDELEILSEAFYERTKMLVHSEKIYSNLYNNSPDMYLSIDANDAKVITCNKTLLDKLGYLEEEVIGQEFFNLYHPDSIDDIHKLFYSFKEDVTVDNEELRLKPKDRSKIYILFSVSSVKDSDGNILHFHTTMRDITEKKEHEQQIKENENLLFQQSKMASMGEMMGNIAHQWRQPLSTITMSSANMRASVELEEELTGDDIVGFTKNIEDQCQYLSKTINDFRHFFMPNKEKNEFNLKDTIDRTIQLVSASLKTHEIKVIEDVSDIKIEAFENELTQALLNIIKNAKDILLTLESTRRLIFIKVYEKDNMAYIEIKDSGGGVSKDIIDRVFEPYFTTKHKDQGTGIGLYMTESIITKHLNGKIYVKNVEFEYERESYKGAKFTVEIPLTDNNSKEREV